MTHWFRDYLGTFSIFSLFGSLFGTSWPFLCIANVCWSHRASRKQWQSFLFIPVEEHYNRPWCIGFLSSSNSVPWEQWDGIEGRVVVPSFGSTLHSDYLRLQIPAAWPAWNQSLDTDLVKVGETGRGTGWSLFISCGQQRTRYIMVAGRQTGCGSREKRPFLCSNHRRQPGAFSAAPLSSTGSLSTVLLELSMRSRMVPNPLN